MSAYVDTSVLGAYYCPESLSTAAERVVRRVRGPVISTLTEVEFFSLIAKKQRLKEITVVKARQVLDLFAAHLAEGYFRCVALTTDHYVKARGLLATFDVTLHTLDALHLSLAIAEKLPIVTADVALAKAAKKHRVKATLVK